MTAPRRAGRPPLPPGAVTERGAQILQRFAQGHSIADIARELWLAEDTVKTHLRRAYRALGARNSRHAVALAAKYRLIRLDHVHPDQIKDPR